MAGIRHCLGLNSGDEMEVHALKQRFGTDSFLVARPAGAPKLIAKTALHATYESLLRGTGCADAPDANSAAWFLDVGTDDDELLALASSLGCGVTVLDPEVKDVRAVDMTRCMNEEPNRPFVVFQVTAGNITNPETLANMSKPLPVDMPKNASAKASLIGLSKPTMLNANLKGNQPEHSTDPVVLPPPPPPMDKTVMLDTIFMPGASNAEGKAEVTGKDGQSFAVNKISVLKVNPKSETTATLKALQGAKQLLQSGRVQCLVTEMNFDLNSTEAFLGTVGELEKLGFNFAHLGSMDYSELEITNQGQYEVFRTDSKQLQELFDTYKRIRSFDERSGFRVYSGSLSLDRKGHYFDYTDLVFACKGKFPEQLQVQEKGDIRFRNGVWWLEKQKR